MSLESDELAPAFDQVAAIYSALRQAGVQFTPFDRHHFVTLARQRIEAKRSHQEHKSEQAWEELRLQLARDDHPEPSDHPPAQDRLLEIRHLLGREEWLQEVLGLLQGEVPKKLLILQGPIGSGKSSELHRLARSLLSTDSARPHLVLCDLPAVERDLGAESALDIFLATVLAEVGTPGSAMPLAELSTRTAFVLETLATTVRPTVLLLDNAEHLLDERGQLADCWQQFLRQFLRRQHRACLVVATREWPGWFEGERLFVAEMLLPPLSEEMGAVLLQRLGLAAVAVEHLRKASAAVGGIPLCLEWVASLVQEPLLFDTWDALSALDEDEDTELTALQQGDVLTRRLLSLLEDPSLFGGPIASKLTPLLQRLLDTQLSSEASQVLNRLAIANIPLGKPALQVLCPRPSLLKELRSTSLLAVTAQRVQMVPMVAALLRARFSMQQQHDLEEQLILALTRWLEEGNMSTSEAGGVVAELATLYLKLQRLLEAAQLLTRYGWLSFSIGYGPRLAKLADEAMAKFDWLASNENECGGFLLHYLLSPFLGKTIDYKQQMKDYCRIQDAITTKGLSLHPSMDINVTHQLLLYALNETHFEEALVILDACCARLELSQVTHIDVQAALLEERALLFARWSEYVPKQGKIREAMLLREKAIELYRQCIRILSTNDEQSLFKTSVLRRSLARCLNNLAYHLNSIHQYEEALEMVESSIALKEKGYAYVGALAASYGEKSQILAALGRFQEAFIFDEKALTEIRRCADAGDTLSQEELWIYQINRGRLYLRIGKIDEAEQLLREALPYVHPRRRVYQMFAKDALEEIEQWRQKAPSAQYQLDWRWVEKFRALDAFDAYWWWAQAGPFNEEEQQQWDQLFTPNLDEATKSQLGKLIIQSRERELTTALAEKREPCLCYPALNIEEVRQRIATLMQLDHQMSQEEPNALVRRLYHDKIEEEIWFLRMIEATYEADNERFWEFSRRLYPPPTAEAMDYAFSHVRQALIRGLHSPETAQMSQDFLQLLREQLHLSFDIPVIDEEACKMPQTRAASSTGGPQTITAQAAKRFFEAVFAQNGYEGWQVVIDPKASGPRVESGLRRVFLQDAEMSLELVKHYFVHELAGHVARSVAGERSSLGLLAIGTKNYSPTEEGIALYNERQIEERQGKVFDDWGAWFGTLVTGLASGVITPPQTFLSLFTFVERFFLLLRLLGHLDKERESAQEKARRAALSTCLRVYRGVPTLQQAGICLNKDAVYLRGLWLVEQAVAQDATILDRLSVGRVALEYLFDLQELGITPLPQTLQKLVLDPNLDSYICSFDNPQK